MRELDEPYQSLFEAVLWDCGADAIPALVSKGADLSFCRPDTGVTALYLATISNRVRVVEALLKYGADPNQRFSYRSPVDHRLEADRVALHYVSSNDIAGALLKAGADVNVADAAGATPLMLASFHGHVSVVKTLLAAGANSLARLPKKRGRKAFMARELAESKATFFRETICDENREAANGRIQCYEMIRDILQESERARLASPSEP